MVSKAKYYHGLNLISFLGPVRIRKLINFFGSAERAWEASYEELSQVDGFGQLLAENFIKERDKIDLDKMWDNIAATGFFWVTWEEDYYPPLLRQIYDPPPIIYFYGDIGATKKPSLAIVGSRRHSLYGKEIAYKLASELTERGFTIVSGMARGIDTWAHKGALAAGGKTIAVLGCGLDICYPPENKGIKEKIQSAGAVLSEFPPGNPPLPQNFPRRNRIISGLSLGTIVVEAGEKSGALITADYALEQGREVFAVPGNISSPYSRGCHRLIKQGAKLVERVEDIIEEISLFVCQEDLSSPGFKEEGSPGSPDNSEKDKVHLKPEEKALLNIIPYEPLTLEEIVSLSEMPLFQVNALLLELELKGVIKQLPGKYFVRN